MEHEPHEIAAHFPLLDEKRYAELRASIAAHGLRQPITLFEGKILDGRHRYRACRELGIEPRFHSLPEGNPWQYVWDLNGERRDLTSDQRYLIWRRMVAGSQEWEARERAIREEANRKRAEAMQGLPYAPKGESRKESLATTCGETFSPTAEQPAPAPARDYSAEQERKASTALAVEANVSRGTVERMERLVREAPELAEQVMAGAMKGAEAQRLLRRQEAMKRALALPEGVFRVIYADPPWEYGNAGVINDTDGYGHAERHYATLSHAELCALDVRGLAAEDAVLFLWATSPMLVKAGEVIKAWGFTYKTSFVWDKVRHNFGHYNSVRHELLLLATRGNCKPDVPTLIDSVQQIERTEVHSQKPEEFRHIIDTLYPHGPRVELFRRGAAPEGWTVWGNEAGE